MKNTKNFMKSAKTLTLTGIVCLTLMLASCSTVQNVLLEDTAATSTPVAQDTYVPQKGGELFISIPKDVQTYDPLLAKNEDLINMLSLVYESPLLVDSQGKIQPNLVETWTVDNTGTDYTFNLRKGVVFHNGDSLTSADVYDTIMDILAIDGTVLETAAEETVAAGTEASAEPTATPTATPTPTASATGTGDNANESTTASEINRYAIYNKDIASVAIVDDYTIEVKMKQAGRAALYFMTFPVRPADAADFSRPVGSGPYEVLEMGDTIQLTVNQSWWKVAPYIQSIVAKPEDDTTTKVDSYSGGLLDVVLTDSIAANKYKSTGKTQIVDYSTNYYDCLIPNLFEESLKNDTVRKAISFAIDRRTMISTVLLNHAVAAEMPVSPNYYAYSSKYSVYEYDPAAAKELLKASGYKTEETGEGAALTLNIIVPRIIGQEYRVEAAREIVKDLTEVGIVCNLEELSENDYSLRIKSGDFSLAYCSYYLDQNMDIGFMFQPDGVYNFGNVASTELIAFVDACNAAVTEEEVIAAYANLQQYFVDKVPQIGLYYRMHSIIADASIMGIVDPVQNHIFDSISSWSMKQNY